MGQLVVTSSANFAVPAAYGGSTTYSTAPASNVGNWARPYQQAICTGCTANTTYLYVDLGAATSLAGVFIDNINVAAIKIQASTDGASWLTSEGTTQYTVSVSQDLTSKRYKVYQALTSVNHRYLRVLTTTATTTDSSGLLKIGSIVPIRTIDDTWTVNPGFPLSREVVSPAREDESFGDKVAVGNPYARLSLASSMMPLSTMKSTVLRMSGYGATPFLVYLNDSDTSEAYIVRSIGTAQGFAKTAPGTLQFGALNLREVC